MAGKEPSKSAVRFYVSPEIRQAVEEAKGGDVSVDTILQKRNEASKVIGTEKWREEYDNPPSRAAAMVSRAPAAVMAMACTFGAIAYGLCQFVAKDTIKQQMAMRARVGFQGLSVVLFMYAAYPMMKEKQEREKDYFPTVDASGGIAPESTKRNDVSAL